jgi:mannose-6-phosphate isomerase-like protein (cupin superfamily)
MNTQAAIEKVNLAEKLTRFTDTWSPKIVGEINDAYVKLVKLQGEFVWHHHDNEDEMFLVVKGRLLMRLRDRDIHLDEGEFVIIPTLNTGHITNERTVADLERI